MLIFQQDGMVWKDPTSSNGVTWACEVGDQTMVCPLIVEDLSIPGQMLIEVSEKHFHLYVAFPVYLTEVLKYLSINTWGQFLSSLV